MDTLSNGADARNYHIGLSAMGPHHHESLGEVPAETLYRNVRFAYLVGGLSRAEFGSLRTDCLAVRGRFRLITNEITSSLPPIPLRSRHQYT